MSVIVVTSDPAVVVAQDSPAITAVVPVSAAPYDYNSLANRLIPGVAAGDVIQLDGNAKLPAIDGSQLLNLPALGFNCGRFSYTNVSTCTFGAFRGQLIMINGLLQKIPAAGISFSNAGLSASTLYYAYVFMNNGVMTGEFSTTAHATSATAGNVGTEIKSGDDTRTLVGMIYTSGSSQFVNTLSQRLVASWFNRVPLPCMVNTATAVNWSVSSSFGEINTAARIQAVVWADQVVAVNMAVGLFGNTSGAAFTANVLLNGSQVGNAFYINIPASTNVTNMPLLQTFQIVTEGMNLFSLGGAIAAGTATIWQFNNNVTVL